MKKLTAALLAGLAGGALLLAASPAGASPAGASTKGARPATSASPGIPANLPAGYTVVTSAFAAPDGVQTHGSVTCPGTEKPTGGGAIIQSSSLSTNLNSSYPTGQSWAVDVNNTAGLQTTVTAYAVCIKAPPTYSVVTSTFSETPMSTQWASVHCPAHTVVTGGGVLSSTASTGVNINSTAPNHMGSKVSDWGVAMSNNTSSTPNFTVYGICRGKPKVYSAIWGGGVVNVAGGETSATVSCPAASVPIGGGGFTGSPTSDTAVDMNTSYTSNNEWIVYENNGGVSSRDLFAAVVCVG